MRPRHAGPSTSETVEAILLDQAAAEGKKGKQPPNAPGHGEDQLVESDAGAPLLDPSWTQPTGKKQDKDKTTNNDHHDESENEDESAILEQQVHILSKEVSKYAKEVSKHKRQNKDILRALNEVNVGRSDEDNDIPMDEVAVDAEVEKRLGKFKQFMYGRLSE